MGLLERLFGRGAGNGNGRKSASGVSFRIDPSIEFISDDGMATVTRLMGGLPGASEAERVSAETAYAAAAYAFVAMRYRASRLAEPPLMVVREDPKSGMDEWLPRHVLADRLETPSPDYDMGELLFRSSISVDVTGHALWQIDADRGGRPGQLNLYTGREFQIKSTADRLRGRYDLKTARGPRSVAPDEVVYFHEVDPASWLEGQSRVETVLSWLNLGQKARATVRELLDNSIWPSVILTPDKDWNPTPEELAQYKTQAAAYSRGKGRALPMLGGGSAEVVSARLRDLVPTDILNRVESVVSSVFGVPAIVLQFLVGMENAPWSQMGEARRMCYEDTIEPLWREYEKRLTRQLLRPVDADRTHFIRFDTSGVRALQKDKQVLSSIAVMWGRMASLNERRVLVGLEPSDDPAADEIPELRPPEPLPGLGAPAGAGEEEPGAAGKAFRTKARTTLQASLRASQAEAAHFEWSLAAGKQLDADRAELVRLAALHLEDAKAAAGSPTPDSKRRFLAAATAYLEGEGTVKWTGAMGPLVSKTARRAALSVASGLGVRYDLLAPSVVAYAKREVGFLVTSVTSTTRDAIAEAVARGVAEGRGARAIAKALEQLPAFNRDRALLVARTEATRVTNGAPTEALQARSAGTGRSFLKRWNTAGDERVRDEHAAMEGETVGLNEVFSNGLDFPQEPNCRCVLTYEEEAGA